MRSPIIHAAQDAVRIMTIVCLTALLAFSYSWLPGIRYVVAENMSPSSVADTPTVRPATNGDPGFGTNGRVVVSFDASSEANDVALQTDNKIVLAGGYLNSARTAGGMALARLNTNGSLDPTFGNGGKVTTPPTGVESAQAAFIQPDGKILAVGYGPGTNTSRAGVLRRFNPDGSSDMSFGSGGRVFTEIPTLGQTSFVEFKDLAGLPDGGIVAVGNVLLAQNSNIVVARFLSNGALNTSFGGLNGAPPGTVVIDVGGFDRGNALAQIRPGDNEILFAGSVTNLGPNPGQFTDGYAAVSLNLVDGRPDTTFGGGDGIETVIFGPGSNAQANAIVRLPTNNEFAMVGNRRRIDDLKATYAVTYHHQDGRINLNKGVSGVSAAPFFAEAFDAVRSGSNLLMAGRSPNAAGPFDDEFVLCNMLVGGSATDRPAAYKVPYSFGSSDSATALAVGPNEKVVIAGVTNSQGSDQMAIFQGDPPIPPVYVGSADNIIRQIDPVTGETRIFATLPAGVRTERLAVEPTADLATPGRIVALGSDQFLYLIDPDGTVTQLPEMTGDVPRQPAFDSHGNLYYTDLDPNNTGSGRIQRRLGITGEPQTIFTSSDIKPTVLAINLSNGAIYFIAGFGANTDLFVMLPTETGGFMSPTLAFDNIPIVSARSIAFDASGENLFVLDGSGGVKQLTRVGEGPNYQLGPNSASGLGETRQITVADSLVLVSAVGTAPGTDALHVLNLDLTPVGPPLTTIQRPVGVAARQVLPPSADLSVNLQVSGISGPFVFYQATVQNTGQLAAENVVFTITVPPNALFSSRDAAPGFTCTSTPDSEGKLSCTRPSVPPGAPGLDFNLSVIRDGNGVFTSTATVATTTREGNSSNDTASASAAVGVLPTLSVSDVTVTEGNAGSVNAVVTFDLSAAVAGPVSFTITSADGSALAGSDYVAVPATQVSFNPLEIRKTFNFVVNGDTLIEPDENLFGNISNATGATVPDTQFVITITDDDAAPTPTPTPSPSPTPAMTVQFNPAIYNPSEGDQSVTLTVTRSGPTTGEAFVSYGTSDGTATERRDYTAVVGRLSFGTGETTKTFEVLVTDDAFNDDGESFSVALTNPVGVSLGAQTTATVNINDNDTADGPSPVRNASFNPTFFVRQNYSDFLGRVPDTDGLNFWVGQTTGCGNSDLLVCRINVAGAFFLSIENQESGFLVHRAHKAAFGNLPGKPVPVQLRDFLAGARRIGDGVRVGIGDWQQQLEANKVAYFDEFVTRAQFTMLYNGMTNAQYVDALNLNAGGALSQSERDALVTALNAGSMTRARVLRAVAEDSDLVQSERNQAFVLAQYFGYLRRDPDAAPDTSFDGYNFWLTKLNQFNGNFIEAEMVKAFILSSEYGDRFGQ